MKIEIIRETLNIIDAYKDIKIESVCLRDLPGFKGVYEFIISFGVEEEINYKAHKIFIKNKPMDLQLTELKEEVELYVKSLERMYKKGEN